VKSIAAPVRDFSKNVIAAVGIVAPANRLNDELLEKNGFITQVSKGSSDGPFREIGVFPRGGEKIGVRAALRISPE